MTDFEIRYHVLQAVDLARRLDTQAKHFSLFRGARRRLRLTQKDLAMAGSTEITGADIAVLRAHAKRVRKAIRHLLAVSDRSRVRANDYCRRKRLWTSF